MKKHKKLFTAICIGVMALTSLNSLGSDNQAKAYRYSYNSTMTWSGGYTNPWYRWVKSDPYTIYRNSLTGETRRYQHIGTFDHTFRIMIDGWGSAPASFR